MIKTLGLLGLLFLTGAGATLLFFWSQATRLPDWYTEQGTVPLDATTNRSALARSEIDESDEIQAMTAQLEQRVSTSLARETALPQDNPTVILTAQEFNQFVVTSIPRTPQTEPLLASVKAINTTIQDGTLESGIVVNTAELPLEQLTAANQSIVKDLLQTFPLLQDQEIYIGIEGQPRMEQGRLVWGEQTQVNIGGWSVPLVELADRLGVPEAALAQTLSLQLGPLNIEGIEFTDQAAIFRGSL